jgi:hypothetical protein
VRRTTLAHSVISFFCFGHPRARVNIAAGFAH